MYYKQIKIRGYQTPVFFGLQIKSFRKFLIITVPFLATDNIPFFYHVRNSTEQITFMVTIGNYEDGTGYGIFELVNNPDIDKLLADTHDNIGNYFNN